MKKIIIAIACLVVFMTGCNKEEKQEQLITAINQLNIKLVETMLKEGVNPNFVYEGKTPLEYALLNDDSNVAKVLIENKAKIENGEGLLIMFLENRALINKEAPLSNEEKVVFSSLFKEVKNINVLNEEGRTLVELAASKGLDEVLVELNESGADFNKGEVVFAAIASQDIKTLQYCLAHVKDKWKKNNEGQTPLHFAIGYASDEIVKELVKSGVPLNEKDNNGETSLSVAKRYENEELIQYLIDIGARE